MTAPIVLIVGAGDYIGAAIARRFAQGGFVVCLARRNGDKLTDLVDEISASGGVAYKFSMDARDEDQTADLFKTIERDIGALDLVIFNVGGNVHFPILETTTRVFQKVWEMACFAGFLTGREAARYMVPRGRGKVFFTGASASLRGKSGYSAFAAGKAGVRMLAQSMARELGPQGIHVAHVVIDGQIMSERYAHLADERPPEGLLDPAAIAETYWQLHCQPRSAWTLETELRPWVEKF